MNKIVLYGVVALFIVGLIGRVLFAFFFPERFADGAYKVLFLDEREKVLFPEHKNNTKSKIKGEEKLKSHGS